MKVNFATHKLADCELKLTFIKRPHNYDPMLQSLLYLFSFICLQSASIPAVWYTVPEVTFHWYICYVGYRITQQLLLSTQAQFTSAFIWDLLLHYHSCYAFYARHCTVTFRCNIPHFTVRKFLTIEVHLPPTHSKERKLNTINVFLPL